MATTARLPVIDVSLPDQERVARDLVDAAVEHGFVYIKNTGEDISVEAVDNAFRLVSCSCPGEGPRIYLLKMFGSTVFHHLDLF